MQQSDIQKVIEKGKKGLSPDSPLFDLFPKKMSNNTIIKEGDNYIALNSPGSSTSIMGDDFDPYISSLNTIKAYSEQTV